MFITKKSISRRTVLRGMGATIALPFLEAMVPASANAQEAPKPVKRFQAFYVPNGMAMPYWSPEGEGRKWYDAPRLGASTERGQGGDGLGPARSRAAPPT